MLDISYSDRNCVCEVSPSSQFSLFRLQRKWCSHFSKQI